MHGSSSNGGAVPGCSSADTDATRYESTRKNIDKDDKRFAFLMASYKTPIKILNLIFL